MSFKITCLIGTLFLYLLGLIFCVLNILGIQELFLIGAGMFVLYFASTIPTKEKE